MLNIYTTNPQGQLVPCADLGHNTIVSLINPTTAEINRVANQLNVPQAFFDSALDQNERPRIEKNQQALLIMLNLPARVKHANLAKEAPYHTTAVGIIHVENHVVIVAREEVPLLSELLAGQHGAFQSHMKTRLSLLLFKAIAESYHDHLGQINTQVSRLQKKLKTSYQNSELFGLINLNKSLVYFSTSLSAMAILYQRLMDGHDIKIHADEEKRLEAIATDIAQTAALTEMRRESLSNLMDAYAAIIHNNLNSVLKVLTTLAIIMVIPTMIGSTFSMNVALPHEEEWISTVVIGIGMVVISAGLLVFFYKKKYLRM
ncbi:MAG: magnesium transporter CorA family protein [Neisseriaceae bacterium]|nr:magnesium transporter CorA family protein [Neisseriaceae bacterium]MBP6863418.1 magnesium transporter CorA family protein [Neisseriaceae bacterium]